MKTASLVLYQHLPTSGAAETFIRVLALLAMPALMVMCGCKTSPNNLSAGAPTNLIRQAAQADHIIVTNRFGALPPEYVHFSRTVRGPEMRQLIRAISLLRPFPGNAGNSLAMCDWQLQFYRGTNRLITANFQGNCIRCDEGEYCERTGVLDKLYGEIMERTSPPEYPGAEK